MKNLITKTLAAGIVLSGLTTGSMAAVILADNFDANTPTTGTFRTYENTIDNGWYRPSQGPSSWDTSGGVMQNNGTGATPTDGYPAYLTGEGTLYNFFSGTSDTQESLNLTFDYSVPAGDTLYVHLWAAQGTLSAPGGFVGNIEAGGGNLANNEGSAGSTLDAYNMLDGATTGFGGIDKTVGVLTGTGSFNASFFVPSRGIPGVANASDIDYFILGFSKDEDGLAGTTTIDNLSFITFSAPEPSSLALIGMGAALLGSARKRKLTAK